MNQQIELPQLILREILPSDVDDFFAMDSDPRVHTFFDNKPVQTKKEIEDIIAFVRQQDECSRNQFRARPPDVRGTGPSSLAASSSILSDPAIA